MIIEIRIGYQRKTSTKFRVSMQNEPKVAIIILNWNNYSDTKECLLSLQNQTYSNFKTILVDNGSTDGSGRRLNEEFSWVIYLELSKNLGFAGGNNAGIERALEEGFKYSLLLNNDTVIGTESLKEAVYALEQEEDIGLATGKIFYYDKQNVIWAAGGEIDWVRGRCHGIGTGKINDKTFSVSKEVDYAPGTLMLIRKEVFHKIGLLPECYFLTGEEAEFSIKARHHGYKVMYIPDFVIWHKVGYSGSTKYQGSSLKKFYINERTRILFMKRNFPTLLFPVWFQLYKFRMWLKIRTSNNSRRKELFNKIIEHSRRKSKITLSDLDDIE